MALKRLYRLFPSKDDLVAAWLRRRDDLQRGAIKARVAREETPQARLLAVFDGLAEWFTLPEFRGCAFVNCFGELGAVNPAVAEAARAHKAAFRADVAALVAEAGLPEALAGQLSLLVEGAISTAAISGTADPAVQAREAARVLVAANR